ncbi:MAG: hypothetical protein HXX17_07995 [Geobacteraceae bacterium]|nr:hypothetical protein [Geobacteraceae bacterium]
MPDTPYDPRAAEYIKFLNAMCELLAQALPNMTTEEIYAAMKEMDRGKKET